MIRTIQPRLLVVTIALISIFTSCNENTSTTATTPEISTASEPKSEIVNPKAKLSDDFKNYWYNGEAEITSYRLEQARYGELREGTAVLVFVTEDFLPDAQVKADNYSKDNTPVLKLNTTKNFITGIYPYSIMQSTFYPVANNQHALKISTSVQEWCGHVYSQLNNRDTFEVTSHSYFQGEADETFNLDKTWTENELWAKLRIDPKSLPVGELELIPSLESVRLNHDPLKAQKANVKLENTSYTITYPELQRTLKINFNPNFPHDILGWEETITSGIGSSAETLTSKATKLESLKSDYWNKKSKSEVNLRETLKLE